MPVISVRHLLWASITVSLVFKLVLALQLPITGDEAYFVLWGRYPDYGYYDHPPMVGWIMALLLQVSDHPLVLRLPAIVAPYLVAYLIYHLYRNHDTNLARWLALIWLWLPVNAINVLITTDTPLVIFSFLAFFYFFQAEQKQRPVYLLLAGMFLGLAFLSKYFAVLIAAGFFFYILFYRRTLRGFAQLLLVYATSLPFLAINLFWNYQHCWDNILFNLYNRNESASLSLTNPALYLLMWSYLLLPILLFYRSRKNVPLQPLEKVCLTTGLVSIVLLAVISLQKTVGLHWVLAFYPMVYLFLTSRFDVAGLKKLSIATLLFALLHIAAIGIAASTSLSQWQGSRYYSSMVMGLYTEEILQKIQQDFPDSHITAEGYTPASVLAYTYKKNVPVFGTGSAHARQDDLLTDYREMDGRNIVVFSKRKEKLEPFLDYFETAKLLEFEIREARFYLLAGNGFRFTRYRNEILQTIQQKYYEIPAWLPCGRCPFIARYFPVVSCN